jgi:hypothetical protein
MRARAVAANEVYEHTALCADLDRQGVHSGAPLPASKRGIDKQFSLGVSSPVILRHRYRAFV